MIGSHFAPDEMFSRLMLLLFWCSLTRGFQSLDVDHTLGTDFAPIFPAVTPASQARFLAHKHNAKGCRLAKVFPTLLDHSGPFSVCVDPPGRRAALPVHKEFRLPRLPPRDAVKLAA